MPDVKKPTSLRGEGGSLLQIMLFGLVLSANIPYPLG